MPLYAIQTYPFDLAAGTANLNVDLDPHDFSGARQLIMDVALTSVGAGGDAADTLNIYFQESAEGFDPVWSDRIASDEFNGAMTVSAAAPELRRYVIDCDNYSGADAIYEGSGSAGGSHLADGTVINGPLLPVRRITPARPVGSSVPLVGRVARYRLRFEVTDADNDSDFQGTVILLLDSRRGY